MEIILLQDVKAIGKEGDIVKVKDGYARNYIIPRRIGVPATDSSVRILEAKKKKLFQEREKEKKAFFALAEKLSGLSLTIPMESGMEDRLFGTVTQEMIFHALHEENIRIDKKSILIKEPINKLGIYNVEITLHREVKANLRIWVVKK